MDTNNEILDAIEILAGKKISENITKVLTGICKSVNINNNTCVMDSNGVSGTVYFYGSPPEVNELYRIFVPSNDMSRAFVIVPPRFTVNPNLLDNWYFGRPVNQRGQTSYSADWIYTIDRWQTSENSTLTVNNGSVSLTGSYIFEPLEEIVDALKGKTVTVSLLFSTGELEFATGVVPTTWGGWSSIVKNSHVGLQGIGEDSSRLWLLITDSAKNILAAKLELGPTQTLAHLENGSWVLNEIPKYEDVLSNCQRYAFNVVNSDDNWEILGVGFAMGANQLFCFIPTPTALRGKPSIAYSGSFRAVRNTGAGDGIVINTMVVDHASNNGVSIICSGTTNFEVGEFYMLWEVPTGSTNSLIFSADL